MEHGKKLPEDNNNMEIQDVLFFDTETTGIPDRSAKWDVDYATFPHIVQIAWMNQFRQESHIIRPDGWEIPEETIAVHGITMERAMAEGEPFEYVIDRFIQDCLETPLICGHNIHFDTGIIKANILRELGRGYYDANYVEAALYKGKRIDTMRTTMKWVDARMANGRLKFPNLSELYSRCFPGETFPAHDAMEDTKAVARCLPVIVDLGLVELKVKEYPEETNDIQKAIQDAGKVAAATSDELSKAAKIAAESVRAFGVSPETAGNGPILNANQKDDKLPAQPAKAPQIGNSAKITGVAAELLDANEF